MGEDFAKTASALGGVLIIEITLVRCDNFSSKMQVLKSKFVNGNTTLWENDPSFTKYKQLRKNIHSKEPEQFMAINADYAWLSRNIIKAKTQ